jgi:hypothetical protein
MLKSKMFYYFRMKHVILKWIIIEAWLNQLLMHVQLCMLIYAYFRLMVFNLTFNTILVISSLSVLLVEETGVPEENHRPVASHSQTLSLSFASSSSWQHRDSNSQLKR